MGNPEVRRWDNEQVIIPAGKYSSLKEAVEKEYSDLSGANLSRADLSWANLSGADLSRANLSWADLSRADLSRANLSWADLSWVNLSGADLSWADLSRADLSRANLSWADLSRANLSWAKIWGEVIKKQPIQISGLGWWITITEKHIQIGCEVHKAEEWFEFKDSRIKLMHEDALDWWKKHKKFIKSAWELHRED